jgi:hypothetical protein
MSRGGHLGAVGSQCPGVAVRGAELTGAAGRRRRSRRARDNRATYELHDRAGEFTSVLFAQKRLRMASDMLLAGSIFPAMQNFLLAARAQGLGACLTSWAAYGGEHLLRAAVGVPEDWIIPGHIVVGWPKGRHGPVRGRPWQEAVNLDHWDERANDITGGPTAPADQ